MHISETILYDEDHVYNETKQVAFTIPSNIEINTDDQIRPMPEIQSNEEIMCEYALLKSQLDILERKMFQHQTSHDGAEGKHDGMNINSADIFQENPIFGQPIGDLNHAHHYINVSSSNDDGCSEGYTVSCDPEVALLTSDPNSMREISNREYHVSSAVSSCEYKYISNVGSAASSGYEAKIEDYYDDICMVTDVQFIYPLCDIDHENNEDNFQTLESVPAERQDCLQYNADVDTDGVYFCDQQCYIAHVFLDKISACHSCSGSESDFSFSASTINNNEMSNAFCQFSSALFNEELEVDQPICCLDNEQFHMVSNPVYEEHILGLYIAEDVVDSDEELVSDSASNDSAKSNNDGSKGTLFDNPMFDKEDPE